MRFSRAKCGVKSERDGGEAMMEAGNSGYGVCYSDIPSDGSAHKTHFSWLY